MKTPLHTPYFKVRYNETEGTYVVTHNVDGRLGFAATDDVDAKTYRLIMLAFEAGKRKRSKEIRELLEVA